MQLIESTFHPRLSKVEISKEVSNFGNKFDGSPGRQHVQYVQILNSIVSNILKGTVDMISKYIRMLESSSGISTVCLIFQSLDTLTVSSSHQTV